MSCLAAVATALTIAVQPPVDGGARQDLTEGPAPVPPAVVAPLAYHGPQPDPTRLRDPRLDPVWVARDRILRQATIGVGAFAGSMVLITGVLAGVTFGLNDFVSDDHGGITGPAIAAISMLATGTIALAGTFALTGVGIAWRAHRAPLRGWNTALSPGGLVIRF